MGPLRDLPDRARRRHARLKRAQSTARPSSGKGRARADERVVGCDAALLGFATEVSYAPGETLQLKVNAEPPPPQYSVTIYCIGWYGGKGARRIASFAQNAPADQPPCQRLSDPADCSNWSVTDVWLIPPGQVSGVYLAKLLPVPQGASNGSYVLFGGTPTSLYNGAARVRYDRPLRRAVAEYVRSFFGARYSMVRFLERNGYDVSYFAGVDTARRGDRRAPRVPVVGARRVLVARDASIGEVRVPQADGQMRLWRGTRAQSAGTCDVTELAPQTIDWSHGLDRTHMVQPYTGNTGNLDLTMAQASANFLADMGAGRHADRFLPGDTVQ